MFSSRSERTSNASCMIKSVPSISNTCMAAFVWAIFSRYYVRNCNSFFLGSYTPYCRSTATFLLGHPQQYLAFDVQIHGITKATGRTIECAAVQVSTCLLHHPFLPSQHLLGSYCPFCRDGTVITV